MFDHIAVPLDGSSLAECVLPHVITFARAFNARVTLLRVLNNEPNAGPRRPIDPVDWEMYKAEATAYLNGIAQQLSAANLPVQSRLLEGDPTRRIVEFTHDQAVDLLVLSTHGQSGLSSRSISSVVLKVIQQVQTAMLIVRAFRPVTEDPEWQCYRRILLPLDGSPRAECVTAAVAQVARACNSQVLLSHIVIRPRIPFRAPSTQEDEELAARVVTRNREAADQYLTQLQANEFHNAEMRLVVEDDVIAGLHEMVESERVDLVVLSAHGYSSSTMRRYGSVTTDFIEYDIAPLLVIQDLTHEDMQLLEDEMFVPEGQPTNNVHTTTVRR